MRAQQVAASDPPAVRQRTLKRGESMTLDVGGDQVILVAKDRRCRVVVENGEGGAVEIAVCSPKAKQRASKERSQ